MSKKEKYKRYGYEDAYDTEKENDWTNRLNLDDCIEIMNNQFNEIVELKQENKTLRRALELASSAVSQYIKIVFNTTERDDIKEQYTKEYIMSKYIGRAKKELEEENK